MTVLRLPDRVLQLGARPLLMGIVNASPDSFSDSGAHPTLADQVAHGEALLEALRAAGYLAEVVQPFRHASRSS